MLLTEKMFSLMSPLVNGAAYWDTTPDTGPEQDYFVIMQITPGIEEFYVEQKVQEVTNQRVQISLFGPDLPTLELLGKNITRAMAEDPDFGACRSYGSFTGGYDTTRKLHSFHKQFGVWYA